VIGLTKSVALEYATRGVRINAIAPGATATEMLMSGSKKSPDRNKPPGPDWTTRCARSPARPRPLPPDSQLATGCSPRPPRQTIPFDGYRSHWSPSETHNQLSQIALAERSREIAQFAGLVPPVWGPHPRSAASCEQIDRALLPAMGSPRAPVSRTESGQVHALSERQAAVSARERVALYVQATGTTPTIHRKWIGHWCNPKREASSLAILSTVRVPST
jgi:hypothetical protein